MNGDPGFVVTGASKGIGAAIALELAGRGRTVACLSRTGALPDGADDSRRVIAYPCDVTDGDRVRAVVDEFAARAGGIQGVSTTRGGTPSAPRSTSRRETCSDCSRPTA
jgi:NAD(P)-dependent dehydrogenase (short-subunit alcohol dehydrogenase family)